MFDRGDRVSEIFLTGKHVHFHERWAIFTHLQIWLHECGIRSVATESNGLYLLAAYQILESGGLEVCLVNAQHAKNVTGRKREGRERHHP